ncbi:MAG: hypothetical protein HKN40_09965 [Winogradskyella sp.]|uniref:hypothetical protein n=1 Tax=Winogradskyella sp. TaxID=1883156 RepID=UPI0017B005D0|nr:hypothetical protein [Winogradskyella sp.]
MGFSLSKIFGRNTSKNELLEGNSVETIIKEVENEPYGVSQNNVLYAGLNELGGYYFFQTVIVGSLKIKSKRGAILNFKGEDFEMQLEADMLEFESEFSGIPNRYVTKIDFKIEETTIKMLEEATLKSVEIKIKNNTLIFTKYDLNAN